MNYRPLQKGEILQEGDECLKSNGKTWQAFTYFIGEAWDGFGQVRRPVDTEEENDRKIALLEERLSQADAKIQLLEETIENLRQ